MSDFVEMQELAKRVKRARADFCEFCEICFTDSETGEPWRLQEFHREWAELLQKHKRLIVFAPTEVGKTSFFSIAYPIYRLGRNPNLRISVISNTSSQAEATVSAIGLHILKNKMVRAVFPKLLPLKSITLHSKEQKWSTKALIVSRPRVLREPSVSAFGVGGAILGNRLDLVILDDILDLENTRTKTQRDYVTRWVLSSVLSRLVKRGQLVSVSTAWHEEDAQHMLAERESYYSVKYSLDRRDVAIGHKWLNWPEKYPPERLKEIEAELGPKEYARQKRCIPKQEEEVMFPSLPQCLVDRVEVGENWRRYIGIDPGTSKRKGTAIVVIAAEPAAAGKKAVTSVMFGAWDAGSLIKTIKEICEREKPDEVVVENNATQTMLEEMLRGELTTRITPFMTTSNKFSLSMGLPVLELEFSRNEWQIPVDNHGAKCRCDNCRLVYELKNYPAGTTDGVMALWLASSPLRKHKKNLSNYSITTI